MPNFMNHEDGKKRLLQVAGELDALRIPFFLMQGTALGAYRDHGFTPTEQDIDLGILYEHFRFKHTMLRDCLEELGYMVECICRPFDRCRMLKAKSEEEVKFDLVTWIRWKDKRFTHNADPNTRPYAIVHEHNMIEDTESLELFGRMFQVPFPITTYLQREYGKHWAVPKNDSRSRTRRYYFLRGENVPLELLSEYTQS